MKDRCSFYGSLYVNNIQDLNDEENQKIIEYVHKNLDVCQYFRLENQLEFKIQALGLNEYRKLLDIVEYIPKNYNVGTHISTKSSCIE